MMALGITFFVILQYVMPPPPEPPTVAPEPELSQTYIPPESTAGQQPAASAAATISEIAAGFNPQAEYAVTVVRGEAVPNGDGYEALFSSVGGSLHTYRLLGYYRLPGKEHNPGDEVILLDRLAAGRESLRIDAVSFGASRQELQTLGMGRLNYELIEAPADAKISPPPGPDVKRSENRLVFRAVVGEWELVKTFTFPVGEDSAKFTINMNLEWRNLSADSRLLLYRLSGPSGMIPDDESPNFGMINFLTARQPAASALSVEVERSALSEASKANRMSVPDNRAGLAWVGAKSRFFAALMSTGSEYINNSNGGQRRAFVPEPALMPKQPDIVEILKNQPKVNVGGGETPVFEDASLSVEPGMIAAGGSFKANYRFYGGPAEDGLMERADPRFSGVISYTISYFDFISRYLVELLTFLDRLLGNYGLAIIAVTLLVRLIMHPLNRKSFVSMNRMQKLAPQMKALQQKYASDKPKMQQEVSKLYKDNNVSMVGGCLPVFIQLPIFFALYGAFSQGFPIRHAAFIPGWINDLSQPDSVYNLGWTIPLLNSPHISILPILYLGLQYFQMHFQPKSSDPQQASQQRIMKIMPLFFVFIFYSMPAGLVLYFAVSALFGVLENLWMRKVLFPRLGLGDDSTAVSGQPVAAKAGAGAEVKANAKKKKKK